MTERKIAERRVEGDEVVHTIDLNGLPGAFNLEYGVDVSREGDTTVTYVARALDAAPDSAAKSEVIMDRVPFVGCAVVYIDPMKVRHDALVTAVWGPTCCNVLWVSGDASKTDPYGRQIERQSSCCHSALNEARANCWCWPDE